MVVKLLSKGFAKVLSFATICLLTTTANASVIVEQTFIADSTAVPTVSANFDSGAAPQLLDNFSVTSLTDITRLTFWTYEADPQPIAPGIFSPAIFSDELSVQIFSDDGNLTNLFSASGSADNSGGTFSKTFATTFTSVFGQSLTVFEHVLDISNLELDAGDYFLSVFANPFTNGSPVLWANANQLNLSSPPAETFLNVDLSSGFPPQPLLNDFRGPAFESDFAFRIEGEASTSVSTPSIASLFALITGLLIYRRKQAR